MGAKYNNLIIYYLSGTGNALNSARWITEEANKKNIKTFLFPIDRKKKPDVPETKGKTLIGFCYPTHGFAPPWSMLKFIFKFPRLKNFDFFLLNTRAGMKFSKIYFPGLSGVAQILPMLFLLIKGFKIAGLLPIDLPSNWISLHPGLSQKATEQIAQRRKAQIIKYSNNLLEKGRSYNYKVFLYVPLDLLVAPISFLYLFVGRFIIAKSFMATSDCGDCRLCIDNCPTGALKMKDNRPYWSFSCESCMRCISTCPTKSIQTAHSFWLSVLYISSSLPLSYLLVSYLDKYNIKIFSYFRNPLDIIISWVITLMLFYVAYWIFFLLIRYKYINKFFEYTSLTRYWRRFISPGIKTKDLMIKK